jgi:hypothetical protein
MIASKWEFPGTLTRRTGWTGWDPARLLLPADLVRHPAENLQQKQRFHHRNIDSIYHHQFTIPNTLIQCQHKDHSIIRTTVGHEPTFIFPFWLLWEFREVRRGELMQEPRGPRLREIVKKDGKRYERVTGRDVARRERLCTWRVALVMDATVDGRTAGA